jgi:ABC-type sulfate transport system substrate-binding protein
VVASSPIVIVTRPGNPYHLNSYADLAQPGLLIIHPDPKGSGAGQWALLAEYGSGLIEYGDRALARKQVEEIWGNVHLLAPSARGALTLFELGAGDVFITYEQDARLALARGVPLEILIPSGTILTQPVAVRVDDNLRPAERPLVESFLEFLRSEAGVSILQRYHWRLTEGQAQGYPTLIDPITVEDLGGWPQAYGDLVESLWESGIEPRLSLESGVTLLEGGD